MTPRIRILVVDDSAFARKVLREVLSADPRLEVIDTARDGLDALEKINDLAPDVVTLDLVMPNLDGLGVLEALPVERRARVVVVSIADDHSDLGVAALSAGAFDLVQKPTALGLDRLSDLSSELVQKVVAAASRPLSSKPATREGGVAPPLVPALKTSSDRIVLIGTSTGGPQALSRLLGALPERFPAPIALVLHIPVGYTAPLAERLNRDSAIDVMEANAGLRLRPGLAVVARAGQHLKLIGEPATSRAHLDFEPYESLHRPSVDALFISAAETWGSRVVAVVLTGMGNDGLAGARAVKAAGGTVLAEAESSCVVYGMPRAVVEAGLADAQVPLEQMAAEMVRRL